ncbi:MAG: TPM domain-containing protein [Bdellovibrio sp.]
MRSRSLPFFLFLAVCFFNVKIIYANEIPAFTSNVIDTVGQLSAEQSSSVLQSLEVIRREADIYGAVFIVDHLEGETIETLAEKAFRKWKLGRKDVDNGLLLVISVEDRKSRFEVGYGLEGDLPDIYAKEALDSFFRPAARNNRFDVAIINSFNFLASKKLKKQIFDESPSQNIRPTTNLISVNESLLYNNLTRKRTFIESTIITFLLVFVLFAMRSFAVGIVLPRAMRFSQEIEGYKISDDSFINKATQNFWKNLFIGDVILKAIIALVLGGFLLVFLTTDPIAALFVYLIALVCNIILIIINVSKYRSATAYRNWLMWEKAAKLRMVKNSLPQSDPCYPPSNSWNSSSGDFFDSSSSSDGGSSGGGGASSDW